jgi:hypothetical protein
MWVIWQCAALHIWRRFATIHCSGVETERYVKQPASCSEFGGPFEVTIQEKRWRRFENVGGVESEEALRRSGSLICVLQVVDVNEKQLQ